MKQPNENKLDKLFRDGVNRPDAPINFSAKDWTAMEKMLNGGSKKKGIIYNWRYYASGIAALLLLTLGLILIIKNDKVKPDKVVKHDKAGKKPYGHTEQQSKVSVTTPSGAGSTQPTSFKAAEQVQVYANWPAKESAPYTYIKPVPDTIGDVQNLKADQVIVAATTPALAVDSAIITQAMAANVSDTAAATVTVTTQPDKKQVKPILQGKPTFTLSILAAPDLNGVNSFNNSQVGTNFGLQLTLHLTSKLSVSTGAAYAVKPYHAGSGQYNFSFAPTAQPTQVIANCKVLDIPLNINYQLYTKGKNSIAVGSGLSSYFMLKENYRFNYDQNSYLKPYDLTVTEKNQHVFGVLNLNATYQRKINAKFSALVQPYIKLPLTGIGNGSVNLKSTGVALGFSWNINPFGKPK